MDKWLWVALGGALGAISRLLVAQWTTTRLGGTFPMGTLLVNLGGSFLLGFIVALSNGRWALSSASLALWGIGFCGAFTTVSTFSVETVQLAQNGLVGLGFLNIVLTNLLAVTSVLAEMIIAKMI